MILDYDFSRETKQFLAKVHVPGICYSYYPAAQDYIREKRIYNSDIRHALRGCEVIAIGQSVVPELAIYWVSGRNIDGNMLTMSVITCDYPIITIEKILLEG
jgi:hypothetical protein